MPLLRSFAALIRETLSLWGRYLPHVGTWLLLGWLLYTGSLLTSALLGSEHQIWSVLIMVLGIIANAVGVLLAIHSLEPGLHSPSLIRERSSASQWLPEGVGRSESKIDVTILAIGPLLGVYSVWGIVDGMVRDGLTWNGVIHTNAPENWAFSLSSRMLPTFLGIGAVAFLLRIIYARLVRRATSSWWRAPLILLEGLWVFATFFIVLIAVREFHTWILSRRIWRDSETNWHRFLDWLPDIGLPFDLTLPEALTRAGTWLLEDFFPGVWEGIALPLVWLAVVAIVFGWREFNARELLRGKLPKQAAKLDRTPSSVSAVVTLLSADLRDKYLPLLHAFRLIWRSGPYLLGAYLVLCALVAAGSHALTGWLLATFAAGDQTDLFRAFSAIDAVRHLLVMSLSVCLYTAAFDRGVVASFTRQDALIRQEPPQAEPEDEPQDSRKVQ